ncbi:MAG: hypothetical protein RR691_04090 [Eubacterium sp.]
MKNILHTKKKSSLKTRKKLVLWWLFLVISLLSSAVAGLSFITTEGNYKKLSLYFEIAFISIILLTLLVTVINRKSIHTWIFNLIPIIPIGVCSTITILKPGLSEDIFAFYVGFSILFSGFITISYSFTLKSLKNKLWSIVLSFSLISILLSTALLLFPIHEQYTLMLWTGIALIGLSVDFFILAFVSLYSNINQKKKATSVVSPVDL